MDDLIQSPQDVIKVEPVELEPVLITVLTRSLAKTFARQCNMPWTGEQESKLQEKISELVAEAEKRHLKIIRLIVTRSDGKANSRELDIERITKTRSVQ